MINIIDRPATEIDDELPGTHTVHWQSEIDEDIDYEQPKMFYEGFSQTDKDHLYSNIAGTLVNVDNSEVLEKVLEQFGKVSPALLQGVRAAYEEAKAMAKS